MINYHGTVSIVVVQLLAARLAFAATGFSVGIESDLSRPTMGMHGQSSLSYDDKNGITLGGKLGELFGPPIKMISNGVNNMINGGNMAGIGNQLKTNGAVLGFDAKMLEAAGGANLLKGGILTSILDSRKNIDSTIAGLPGQKIGNVIEMPVKVVAIKDLTAGKVLNAVGKYKVDEAQTTIDKGSNMVKDGNALRKQGFEQVVQGAGHGLQSIGQAMQQSANNAANMFKLLPIMLDVPVTHEQQVEKYQEQLTKTGEQQVQQQQVTDVKQAHQGSRQSGSESSGIIGGSLFGGLGSLMPDLMRNDPFAASLTGIGPMGPAYAGNANNKAPSNGPAGNIFATQGHGQTPHLAAVLNVTDPLTALLANSGQSMNAFLQPISSGPLGQALTGKDSGSFGSLMSTLGLGSAAPLGSTNLFGLRNRPSSNSYSLFPGVRITESSSIHPHGPIEKTQQQQQQVQVQEMEKIAPQQKQQQQQVVKQKRSVSQLFKA